MRGWKQAYTIDRRNLVIVEIDIPDDADVTYIPEYGFTKDIYTCDKASVVSITSFDCMHSVTKATSLRYPRFMYAVGDEVHALINENIGNRPGIYFFNSRERAIKYEY